MSRPIGDDTLDPKMSPTLKEAFEHACRTRWAHTRGRTLESQARIASDTVARIICGDAGVKPEGRFVFADLVNVASVTTLDIERATREWYGLGIAPATINKRLNCLSVMGVKVAGCKVKEPNALKWWLSPQEEARAVEWLVRIGHITIHNADLLATYIQWTTRTGLRVEESLRLKWSDLTFAEPPIAGMTASVMVPGLKTATSQATLPLGEEAAAVMINRFTTERDYGDGPAKVAPLPLTYEELLAAWDALKEAMGWPKEATLKALRRSAARYLHVDCGMPLDMVRQYLRHEDIKTTMGYLRLTGGYGTEEMRRYLK